MKVRDNWHTITTIKSGAGSIVHFQYYLLKAATNSRGQKQLSNKRPMSHIASLIATMSNFDSSTTLVTWLYQTQCKDRSKCTNSFINIQFVFMNLNDSTEYVQSYNYDLFRKLAIEVLFGLSVTLSPLS